MFVFFVTQLQRNHFNLTEVSRTYFNLCIALYLKGFSCFYYIIQLLLMLEISKLYKIKVLTVVKIFILS